MTNVAAMITASYCQTHRRILAFAEKLADEQMSWRASPNDLSIAFHLWHTARWADYFQAAIPGMTEELQRRLGPGRQIWEHEGLARQWGFDAPGLGYAATGMHMDGDLAITLRFPDPRVLLAYARQAFAAAEHAVGAIDEQQFQATEQPQPLTEGIWGGSTVGQAIVDHIIHDNRHLGMMECLLGFQTKSGTATV
ncbi:MAG TPA: DinB family protein [Roseiflexaceae bacterium]|nr:DinB family protein [Roseiflexaceae bacterium]